MQKLSKYPAGYRQLVESGRGHVLQPLVAQSTRALLTKIVEDFTPSEGIYYCVRNPDGWAPFSYRFDEYPEIDHMQFWEEYVVPVLAMRWAPVLKVPAKRLESELNLATHGFPRGRVVRNSRAQFVVMHGNDTPKAISSSTINRLFSLPATVKWESDEHERCQADDRDTIRRTLRLKETWPAVSF